MATSRTVKPAALSMDQEGSSILYEGANMSQMSILFKVDDRILKERMHGIQPIGKRFNAPIYDVAEVAGRMARLTEEQVDKAMMRLNAANLPKMVTKEYWAGKRSRQAYEVAERDLWQTTEVVTVLGEVLKKVKMSAQLMIDAVERTTELSDKQREIIKEQTDGMLMDIYSSITESTTKNVKTSAPDEDDDPL